MSVWDPLNMSPRTGEVTFHPFCAVFTRLYKPSKLIFNFRVKTENKYSDQPLNRAQQQAATINTCTWPA